MRLRELAAADDLGVVDEQRDRADRETGDQQRERRDEAGGPGERMPERMARPRPAGVDEIEGVGVQASMIRLRGGGINIRSAVASSSGRMSSG
jgi:hypothetical protein